MNIRGLKKLAILGASYLQVPLITKAKKMGIETHVFAWEDGAVARNIADHFYPVSILDKGKILSFCKSIRPGGIISIGSDIAMPTVNYVAQKLNLTGNNLSCSLVTTNKLEMRRQLINNKIPCPRYISFSADKIFRKDLVSKLDYPLIVKPVDRSGSRGITLIESPAELETAVDRAMAESFSKTIIIEEFINGREVSVEMISWKGTHHFLAITEKVTTGAPYFVEVEQHEPAFVTDELYEKIIGITSVSLSALGVENGASHSELIITQQDEIFVVEIGARMGGDNIGAYLVEMSTGYDFVKGVIDVALGSEPSVIKHKNGFAGIYYLTPQRGKVKEVLINTYRFPQVKHYEVFIKPGMLTNYPVRDSSQRSGYFIYESTTPFRLSNSDEVINIIVD